MPLRDGRARQAARNHFRAMHDESVSCVHAMRWMPCCGENGVDMARFNEAMSSFAVAAKVNRARALMRRYGVRSVPGGGRWSLSQWDRVLRLSGDH